MSISQTMPVPHIIDSTEPHVSPFINWLEVNSQKAAGFMRAANELQYSSEPTGTKGIIYPKTLKLDSPDASFFQIAKIENGAITELAFSDSGEQTIKQFGSSKENFNRAVDRCRMHNKNISSLYRCGKFHKLVEASSGRDDALAAAASAMNTGKTVSLKNIEIKKNRVVTEKEFLQKLESIKSAVLEMIKRDEAAAIKFESDRLKELEIISKEYAKLESECASVLPAFGLSIPEADLLNDEPRYIDDEELDEISETDSQQVEAKEHKNK